MDTKTENRAARTAEAEVLVKDEDFAALEEEWEELYEECPSATPFQSWAWLYSWWEHYGEDYKLQLVVVRNEQGLLVGILPLMIERGGLRRLLFVGTAYGSVLDMLVREGWHRQVCAACGQALLRLGAWRVADLRNLRSTSAVWGLVKEWSGPVVRVPQAGSPVMKVMPWEKLVASLSKNHRSTVRRAIRRAEKDSIQVKLAGEEESGEAARRLVALHRESWQGRDIAPEHLTESWASYIEAAARRMTKQGKGAVSEFWRDGKVIAAQFLVFGAEYNGFYTFGARQEALKRYQISSLLIWDAINVVSNRNGSELDLMQGEDSYKLRWADRVDPVYRMILGKNIISWLPYTVYRRLRVTVKYYLYSQSTPLWVKDFYEWTRNLPKIRGGHGGVYSVSRLVRDTARQLRR